MIHELRIREMNLVLVLINIYNQLIRNWVLFYVSTICIISDHSFDHRLNMFMSTYISNCALFIVSMILKQE